MTDVSAGFRPPCWCPSRWAPAWRLHTNLYKFGENVSPHIFHKKNFCDLNLGESLCISTFFLFPDSGLNLLNGFDFLFWSILNGVTLKTSNWWPWISWQSIEVRIVKCFNWYWFPVRRGFRCYLTCIRPVVSRAVLLTGLVGLGLGWLLWCMLGMLSCHMLFEATAFPEWWFTLQTFKGFLIWNFTKKMTISSL